MQMKGFCEDRETCRHVQLLRYFGEVLSSGACKNTCDNCLRKAGQKHDPDWPELVKAGSFISMSWLQFICCLGLFQPYLAL